MVPRSTVWECGLVEDAESNFKRKGEAITIHSEEKVKPFPGYLSTVSCPIWRVGTESHLDPRLPGCRLVPSGTSSGVSAWLPSTWNNETAFYSHISQVVHCLHRNNTTIVWTPWMADLASRIITDAIDTGGKYQQYFQPINDDGQLGSRKQERNGRPDTGDSLQRQPPEG